MRSNVTERRPRMHFSSRGLNTCTFCVTFFSPSSDSMHFQLLWLPYCLTICSLNPVLYKSESCCEVTSLKLTELRENLWLIPKIPRGITLLPFSLKSFTLAQLPSATHAILWLGRTKPISLRQVSVNHGMSAVNCTYSNVHSHDPFCPIVGTNTAVMAT